MWGAFHVVTFESPLVFAGSENVQTASIIDLSPTLKSLKPYFHQGALCIVPLETVYKTFDLFSPLTTESTLK